VLLDTANPLDFSAGFPPTLFVKDTDSLGEQIQAAFPELKVVKALNTLAGALMVNPRQLADGDHSVFVCGNHADAKKTVTSLLARTHVRRRGRDAPIRPTAGRKTSPRGSSRPHAPAHLVLPGDHDDMIGDRRLTFQRFSHPDEVSGAG
jgi:hypothetical protein